jgi:hypothetical protein
MPELHLSISLHSALLAGALVLAAALTYAVYRTTIPPIPTGLRVLLITLRALAVFLLIFLIGEPLFSLIARSTQPPVVAVLVDNSRSMTIRDRTGDRSEQLRSVITSPSLKRVETLGEARYVLFDAKPRLLDAFAPESLSLAGDATDIGLALKQAKELANLQAAVVISDGNNTTGSNPVYEAEDLGVPVFTVGVGDTSEPRDVLVRKVTTNSIVYTGNRVPVFTTVRSSGYSGERVEVVLREGATVHDRRTITLEGGTRDYSTTLFMTPQNEGMQKFTAEVSSLPNELTMRNNTQDVFVKVLSSKMQVVLIAGAPSPDVAFVRRALDADENVELRTFIERGGGEFYEGPLTAASLERADCLVLIGFPGPATSQAALNVVAGGLAAGKSAFVMLSRTVDVQKLRMLEPHLPFTAQGGSGEEHQVFFAAPDARQSAAGEHPLVAFGVGRDGAVWDRLPPIFRVDIRARQKPEANVFGVVRLQNVQTNEPLLVARNVAQRRSVALLGYGIWRWKMFGDGVAGTENVLDQFLSNSLRWLTTRDDERPVRVQPVKEVFTTAEAVEFTAQVYDESLRPVEHASIAVTIARGAQQYEFTMNSLGSGQYEGGVEALEEGDYRFTATVRANGQTVAEERGTFSVGGTNVEFLDTRMNKELLQQIAARTGGKYYDAASLGTVADDIAALPTFQPQEVVRADEIELWNRWWMLAVVVGLFAVEWFLRKRNGML